MSVGVYHGKLLLKPLKSILLQSALSTTSVTRGATSKHVAGTSLVLLSIVSQNEVFESHLHSNPLLIHQRGPNMVRLRNGGLVWLEDHLTRGGGRGEGGGGGGEKLKVNTFSLLFLSVPWCGQC